MNKSFDYIGFTIDGVHSSELGILRVSGGSRYSEDLLPSFNNRIETVNGREGSFYFGTNYTQRNISFEIAFDSMTEVQKSKLTLLLGQKKLMKIIFDESPYKYYMGRVSDNTKISFIPFDNGNSLRYYKGEGQVLMLHSMYVKCF